jgi:hypothetical protein
MTNLSEYKKFLDAHGKRVKDSIWKLKEPIPAFKKVLTYTAFDDRVIAIYPHLRDADLERAIRNNPRFSNKAFNLTGAIANLMIPKGAFVHFNKINFSNKLRADKALVHSIVRAEDQKPVAYGLSSYDRSFMYLNGAMLGRKIEVEPAYEFYKGPGTCESGIHFYLELDAALKH